MAQVFVFGQMSGRTECPMIQQRHDFGMVITFVLKVIKKGWAEMPTPITLLNYSTVELTNQPRELIT